MVYMVLEIQNTNDNVSTLINSYKERNDAESKYHQILTYAAISSVPLHTAVLLSDVGKVLKSESYSHITSTEE